MRASMASQSSMSLLIQANARVSHFVEEMRLAVITEWRGVVVFGLNGSVRSDSKPLQVFPFKGHDNRRVG